MERLQPPSNPYRSELLGQDTIFRGRIASDRHIHLNDTIANLKF